MKRRYDSAGPTVSVVIPCYNAADFLHETLQSVLAQSHVPVEVLVIDDGSTDDSAQIADSYGPLVRVIGQENRGESVARNRGVAEAGGDWVAFVDADDVWEPDKLEAQLAAATDDAVTVHTGIYSFGRKNRQREIWRVNAEERYSLGRIALDAVMHVSTLMIRREQCPRFPAWTRHSEDLIFHLELALLGRITMVPRFLAGYRFHENNQSQSLADMEPRRHRVVERWIGENTSRLSDESISELRNAMVERLVRSADRARRDRDWMTYWATRNYLGTLESNLRTRLITGQRIYPPWLYRIRDAFRRRNRVAIRTSASTQ